MIKTCLFESEIIFVVKSKKSVIFDSSDLEISSIEMIEENV